MPPLTDFQPPLAAILRGLPPADAPAIGQALFDAGWRIVEVPLNRPGALQALEAIARVAPADALVGAGTVLDAGTVDAVAGAGGALVVAPNCEPAVIECALARGLHVVPGVGTASEAFTALRHGARTLKLFPAEVWGPHGLKALKAVLPEGTGLWPVGGVGADTLAPWVQAGATGLGIGGSLYRPGDSAVTVAAEARRVLAAWRATGGA